MVNSQWSIDNSPSSIVYRPSSIVYRQPLACVLCGENLLSCTADESARLEHDNSC